ncbi:MAG: cytochrome c biogenesis protein CcsA [Muribaculaceae bacterium]|nr:cytochrome c biogenesis protein CcsA [Muribaculaceae bacterium]
MRRTEVIVFASAVGLVLLIGLSSLLPADIYSSAVWHILWIVVALALIIGIICLLRKTHNAKRTTLMERLWRNRTVLIMHFSFLCMIAGGFCTSLFSRRGTLHLLPSQTADYFITASGKTESLPTAVTLLSFSPEYYPGMNFPRDFRSELKTESGDTMHISMNHIGRLGNYRFYQTSFDEKGGTVLTVTYDPAGIAVTYTGFLLFVVGGALWLFRRSGKKFMPGKGMASALMAICCMASATGNAYAVPAVDARLADSLAARQVFFNGEAVSFTGFSTRLTYKLTGRDQVSGLSPEAFVASLIKYKEDWSGVPFIKVKSKALREALSVKGKYVSVADLYDEKGDYIPERLYKGGDGPLDKDILSLDERIALLIDLWKGDLFTPIPPESPDLRSNFSMKSEIFYYRVNPLKILFICAVLISVLVVIVRKKNPHRKTILFAAILAIGCAGIAAYAWLWYISGRLSLSDTPGLMEFLGICMILLSALAAWRKEPDLLVALGMAAASFLLLVALLASKDPVMSPLMPVLASPWLSIHVSLVMLSYAILGFTLPVSLTALMVPSQRERLTRLSISLLGPGVFLLGLGIITGSMWANVSWGRYWAWDPKETWSLVTFLLYSIPLHKYFRMQRLPVFCCIYLIFAFSAILMTYFGVNLLPSLHAYN